MAAPADDIRLALYRGTSAELVTVADYLALPDAERASLAVSPSWCTLSLIVDGSDRWGARLSLGALGVVVAQLAPAAARLEHGERAIVRAAVFDVAGALLLLFEPAADGEVAVTLAATDELPDPSWTPGERNGERLYAFVGEHRDRLVEAGRAREVAPQRIGRAVAAAALRREAELGTAAVALLGPGSC